MSCINCYEFGRDECPCCEKEPEEIELICPSCTGEGKYYLRISDGTYLKNEKEYKNLSIFDKIDIEVEDCEDCQGKGYITIFK